MPCETCLKKGVGGTTVDLTTYLTHEQALQSDFLYSVLAQFTEGDGHIRSKVLGYY